MSLGGRIILATHDHLQMGHARKDLSKLCTRGNLTHQLNTQDHRALFYRRRAGHNCSLIPAVVLSVFGAGNYDALTVAKSVTAYGLQMLFVGPSSEYDRPLSNVPYVGRREVATFCFKVIPQHMEEIEKKGGAIAEFARLLAWRFENIHLGEGQDVMAIVTNGSEYGQMWANILLPEGMTNWWPQVVCELWVGVKAYPQMIELSHFSEEHSLSVLYME